MRHAVRCNVPPDPLKWSVDRAAVEFKLAPHTLRKNLIKDGAEPDAGFCYTTEQICQAIFGSMHVEKLATQRELTKKLSLENQIVEASVLDRAALAAGFAALADAISSRIMVSGLTRDEKTDLLKELSSVPLVLDSVAKRQTRLRPKAFDDCIEHLRGARLAKNAMRKPRRIAIRLERKLYLA
jgi:hypothetical protein